ncbi:glyoxalase superfamily protein [Devosia sp.]|uniref:glyoxalase superfamily protein n=1 Tax=Devosia sp. TaxID=1871048 RepID=UPI001ACEF67E|nr:glyoxalase superfamily protein [Devosia sp.]MBN9335426.1 VOC family protein [Devosia sp.]
MNDIADHGVRFGRIAPMLPVSDMTKAEAFYAEILGFTKVFENGTPVGFMILKRDAAELHLSLQPQHKAADFNVAHLLVDDAEALFLRCKAAGLRIIKGLKDKDYGLRAFVFEDPDGNRIDVGQIIERTTLQVDR